MMKSLANILLISVKLLMWHVKYAYRHCQTDDRSMCAQEYRTRVKGVGKPLYARMTIVSTFILHHRLSKSKCDAKQPRCKRCEEKETECSYKEGKVAKRERLWPIILDHQMTASGTLTLSIRQEKSTAVKASSFERLLNEILPTLDKHQRQSMEQSIAQVRQTCHAPFILPHQIM